MNPAEAIDYLSKPIGMDRLVVGGIEAAFSKLAHEFIPVDEFCFLMRFCGSPWDGRPQP